jgi:hypothetical protein
MHRLHLPRKAKKIQRKDSIEPHSWLELELRLKNFLMRGSPLVRRLQATVNISGPIMDIPKI